MTPKESGLPGPSTLVSVIVLVLGLTIGAVGVVEVVLPFVRTLSAPSFATPGTGRLHLSHGTYLVYERTDAGGFGLSGDTNTTLTTDEVVVSSESGDHLALRQRFGSVEQITRNGSVYVGAIEFEVPSSGEYTVFVNSNSPGRVVVAHPLTDAVYASLKWVAAIVLGGGTALAGIVMWIVGASRRRRRRMTYAYSGGPAAGWYPDPQQPSRLRYWDGTQWTEHVH